MNPAEFSTRDYFSFLSLCLAALALIYSIYLNHQQVKLRKRMDEAQARGNAPYLIPSKRRFNSIFWDAEGGETRALYAGDPHLLCVFREEVEGASKDDAVVLVIENTGERMRRVSVRQTALKEAHFLEGTDMNEEQNFLLFLYAFDPAQNGQRITLNLRFEMADGTKGEHVYETIHGKRHFKRIKPE